MITRLAAAYYRLSAWSVFLFLGPAFGAHGLLPPLPTGARCSERPEDAYDHLERAHLSFATALVAALDYRGQYTAGHSAAVAVYARDTAVELGLSAAISSWLISLVSSTTLEK